ncbi:hypothetical protein E4U58_005167 [Claviceps cyperi]|nr:hypothetical protein E4U58_005167 [Claviceps cyperi]
MPQLVAGWNQNYRIFDGARDDERLSHFNRVITCGWQANTDVSPCTCIGTVVNYVVKYVSKAERHTLPFAQLVEEAINKCTEPNQSGTSVVLRTMNSLIAERDWSAQEAMHVFIDEDMVVASRAFQNVDLCHPDHYEAQVRIGADGAPTQCRSLYSKCLNRLASFKEK